MRHPAALFALLAPLAAGLAGAQPQGLSAQDGWIRATPGSSVAAAYLTLHNAGTAPVVIVGVRCPCAGHAMIHETTLADGLSTMRPHERLRIAGGETVQLAPGGLHIMLSMLTRPLLPGEQVPLQLLLEGGGTVAVTARVRALGGG